MEARKNRERLFHNKAFSEGTRDRLEKYYTVVEASRGYYMDRLRAIAPGNLVLEYGCGPGSMAFLLGHLGATVIGIDISEVAVRQAAERAHHEGLESVSFRVMDAEALQFESNTFDLICGTGILHHLDLRRSYAEIARTLKPNGVAVFTEPLGHNPFINLYRKLTPSMRTVDEHPLHMADLRLAGQYFGKVEKRYFHLNSLLAVPFRRVPGFRGILSTLDAADRALFTLVPPLRPLAWQVVLVLSEPIRPAPNAAASVAGGTEAHP